MRRYIDQVWYACSPAQLARLEAVQRRALRAMTETPLVARNAVERDSCAVEPLELAIIKRRLVYDSTVFRAGPASLRGPLATAKLSNLQQPWIRTLVADLQVAGRACHRMKPCRLLSFRYPLGSSLCLQCEQRLEEGRWS